MVGPKISVVMMVRNEEGCVGSAIDSIPTGLAGCDLELVVVDTGSTDDTMRVVRERAKAAGIPLRMESMPWGNDFSEVRRRTFEMASGEWVFILDADEVIREGSRNWDSDFFSACFAGCNAIHGSIYNMAPQHGVISAISWGNVIRLWRRKGLTSTGPIHNQFGFVGGEDTVVYPGKYTIEHYGYASPEKNFAKSEMRRGIIAEAMRRSPSNPAWPLYMAMSLMACGDVSMSPYHLSFLELSYSLLDMEWDAGVRASIRNRLATVTLQLATGVHKWVVREQGSYNRARTNEDSSTSINIAPMPPPDWFVFSGLVDRLYKMAYPLMCALPLNPDARALVPVCHGLSTWESWALGKTLYPDPVEHAMSAMTFLEVYQESLKNPNQMVEVEIFSGTLVPIMEKLVSGRLRVSDPPLTCLAARWYNRQKVIYEQRRRDMSCSRSGTGTRRKARVRSKRNKAKK